MTFTIDKIIEEVKIQQINWPLTIQLCLGFLLLLSEALGLAPTSASGVIDLFIKLMSKNTRHEITTPTILKV